MHEIKVFLFGFILWYAIQILDLLMQLLSSYASLIITKHQVIINQYQEEIQKMVGEKQIQERTPAIGFVCNNNQYDED